MTSRQPAAARSLDLPALGDKISALERWAARIERMQAERDGDEREDQATPGSTPPSPARTPAVLAAKRAAPPPQPALPRFSARGQDLEPASGSAALTSERGAEDRRENRGTNGYVSLLQEAHAALLAAHQEATARVQEARLESARRLARAQEEAQEIRAAAEIAARRLVAAADELNELRISLAEREAEAVLAAARQRLEQLVEAASREQPRQSDGNAPATSFAPPLAPRPVAIPAPPVSPHAAGAEVEHASPISEEERHALFPIRQDAARQESEAEPVPLPLRLAPRSVGAGEFDLVAGPFVRFEGLTRFTQALRALPGVRAVTVRRFAKRMVHLRVNYRGGEPLVALIERLHEFEPKVVRQDERHIELRVSAPADAAANGERHSVESGGPGRGVA